MDHVWFHSVKYHGYLIYSHIIQCYLTKQFRDECIMQGTPCNQAAIPVDCPGLETLKQTSSHPRQINAEATWPPRPILIQYLKHIYILRWESNKGKYAHTRLLNPQNAGSVNARRNQINRQYIIPSNAPCITPSTHVQTCSMQMTLWFSSTSTETNMKKKCDRVSVRRRM